MFVYYLLYDLSVNIFCFNLKVQKRRQLEHPLAESERQTQERIHSAASPPVAFPSFQMELVGVLEKPAQNDKDKDVQNNPHEEEETQGDYQERYTVNVKTQTDPTITEIHRQPTTNNGLLFICEHDRNTNSVATQCCTPMLKVDAATETLLLPNDIGQEPEQHQEPEQQQQQEQQQQSCKKEFWYQSLENDEDCKIICGVSKAFLLITNHQLENKLKKNRALSKIGKIILYFVKLRHNLPFCFLAKIFGIHRQTVSKIFDEVLNCHYEIAKEMTWWLTKEEIKLTMPKCFKEKYSQTRVIIDASEVKVERPLAVDKQVLMYSHYKSCHTVKFLIGIAPCGFITFMSRGWGGRSTDGQLTSSSGLLELLEPGDLVMADKGFPSIEADILNRDSFIVMPPFKKGDQQFSQEQNKEGYKIASVRIHVERSIARLKQFQILKLLDHSLYGKIDQILLCLAFIANNFPPLIRE